MAAARFPWDSLKAESLRIVCRDLGRPSGRRDEMISFLRAVEEQGLEDALQLFVRSTPERKPDEAVVTPVMSLKRSRQPVVSDYNTRHREKRARISDPGPRRKAGRRPNGPNNAEAAVHSPKRPRSKAAPSAGTSSGRRTIFDGVVLPRFFSSAGKSKDKVEEAVVSNGAHAGSEKEQEQQEEQEQEQDEKAEPDEVDHVLEGAEDPMPESSLASSNKENEGISPARASGDEVEPAPGRHSTPFPSDYVNLLSGDADSSPHSQRVLENIVEVAAQMTDEDMDAEGEMVADHEHEQEMAVRQDVAAPVLPDVAQLSPEVVGHTELFVQTAVENGHAL